MNNISSSISDMTDSAVDSAGDALDFATDLAGTAIAAAAPLAAVIPGGKTGLIKKGFGFVRRHPAVIITGLLAAVGFKYWQKQREADDSKPDSFPQAPSKQDSGRDSADKLTADTKSGDDQTADSVPA